MDACVLNLETWPGRRCDATRLGAKVSDIGWKTGLATCEPSISSAPTERCTVHAMTPGPATGRFGRSVLGRPVFNDPWNPRACLPLLY